MTSSIKTTILFLSDTHGQRFQDGNSLRQSFDVVVHSGDLTEGSKLDEYQAALELLKGIDAPLKLVIAGNHDFTLDIPVFKRKIAEAVQPLEPELVVKHYGAFGEARGLFDASQDASIVFLDEGQHSFTLKNGARLTVYASPYTPSYGEWGFQYWPKNGANSKSGHEFAIEKGTDIVISHGPPKGVLDRTAGGERAGCPDLFAAVARARPRIHCFGHIHEGWGAKKAAWRPKVSEEPSHFTDIDNEKSDVIGTLSRLPAPRLDPSDLSEEGFHNTARYSSEDQGCHLEREKHTIFVNASIQDTHGFLTQRPWVVQLLLDKA